MFGRHFPSTGQRARKVALSLNCRAISPYCGARCRPLSAGWGSLEQQQNIVASTLAASPCNVLMIYPRFMADSFWNFSEACELVGARYPAIPLGLITVAALLPKSWNVRLVNRNTEELTESDLDWADMDMN